MLPYRKFFWVWAFLLGVSPLRGQDIKELLSNFEKAQEDEARVLTGLQLARAYYKDNQIENALKYYSKAENIERKKKTSDKLAKIYEETGSVYQYWQGYTRSLHYFGEANKLYEAQNNSAGQKSCLRQMAWSNFKIGQYLEAQKNYENLLKIHQALGERPQQADIYTRLAVIAELRKMYPDAISQSEKALAIQQANGDYEGVAKSYNNLGVLCRKAGDSKKSLAYFQQALDLYQTQISHSTHKNRKAQLYSNLGVVYTNMRQFDNALKAHEKALSLRKEQQDPSLIANVHNEIATNYYLNSNNERAKGQANDAIRLAEPIADWEVLYDSYTVLANIYKSEGNLTQYETYSKLAAKAQREIDKRNSLKEQELLNKKFAVENFDASLKLASAEEDKQRLEKEAAEKEAKASKAEAEAQRQRALAAQALAEAQRAEADRARAFAERAEQERQIALVKEREAKKEKELAESRASEEEAKRAKAIAEKKTAEAQRAKAIAEAEQAKKDKERLQAEQQSRNQFYLFSMVIGFIVLVLFFIVVSYIRSRRTNYLLKTQQKEILKHKADLEQKHEEILQQHEEILAQRDAIAYEQKKSDDLLLNILPLEVAKELKESNHATPKYYESATVLFTDFKGFTNAAAKMTPQEVIAALDICFVAFDEISEKYGLEKIKTIGDAYMCAGGVPIANTTHAIDAVRAGLEIQEFMMEMRRKKEANGEPYWELRVGVNSGALVAGVVGKKKFAYDIWGDTVNLASRMESSGEPGKVNISGFTYELVKDYFEFTYRGKVPAKNKGEVDMYFVDKWKGRP